MVDVRLTIITVKAKGDLGTHPIHGPIIKGKEYTIDESLFAEELFERPSKGWLTPAERAAKEAAAAAKEPAPAVPGAQEGGA